MQSTFILRVSLDLLNFLLRLTHASDTVNLVLMPLHIPSNLSFLNYLQFTLSVEADVVLDIHGSPFHFDLIIAK